MLERVVINLNPCYVQWYMSIDERVQKIQSHKFTHLERWMDGWIDGWVGGWMSGWMDGWMDR